MTMEVMVMEKVTGCPPKSPIGPMVTVEPGHIAESVGVGMVVRVIMVGISVARTNGVAVTGATIQASSHCTEQ
jgi:hypothetical protein